MGNKINPLLFRLGINYSWQSHWINNNNLSNYHCLLKENLFIKNIIKFYYFRLNYMIKNIQILRTTAEIIIILEGIAPRYLPNLAFKKEVENNLLTFLKIKLKVTIIKIQYISIFKHYRLKYKNQKKNYTRLKKLTKHLKYFKHNIRLINIINYVLYYKNTKILLDYITVLFKNQHKKKHYRLISVFKKLIRILYSKFNAGKHTIFGFNIAIKGRINGRNRARKIWIKLGNSCLSSLKVKINYNFSEFINKDGIFSIKMWLFYF